MKPRCDGKKRHMTFSAAAHAAKIHARHDNDPADGVFRAYPCPHCGGFHVGSTLERRVRKPIYVPPIDYTEISK